MNAFDLLRTTLEGLRNEEQDLAARGAELEDLIAAYEVVLADMQGIHLNAPEPAAEAASEPDPAPEDEVDPELVLESASEVDRIVAQIDMSIPYREMTTLVKDAWLKSHGDQIRKLFGMASGHVVCEALGMPIGSLTGIKKKVGAVIYDPSKPLERRAKPATMDRPAPPQNGDGPPSRGDTPAESGECAHQWDIATPNGPTSQGVCGLCGETKDFANSMPHSGWDRKPKADPA